MAIPFTTAHAHTYIDVRGTSLNLKTNFEYYSSVIVSLAGFALIIIITTLVRLI